MKLSLCLFLICSLFLTHCKSISFNKTETADSKFIFINKINESIVRLKFELDIFELEEMLINTTKSEIDPFNIYSLSNIFNIEKLKQEYLQEIESWIDKPFGSGFVVSKNGQIITCAHVTNYVKGVPGQLYAEFINGNKYKIINLVEDIENDIAIGKLKTDKNDFIPLLLKNKRPKKGERVVSFGSSWPVSYGFVEATVVWGDYSVKQEDTNVTKKYIVTTQTIIPGFSGGPLINKNNKVIGMNYSVHNYGSFSFYIPTSIIINSVKNMINESEKFDDAGSNVSW